MEHPLGPYRALYAEWEKSRWSASDIDFSEDASDWRERLDEIQRRAAQWNYSMFLAGVDSVARALSAILVAAPGPRSHAFVSTQIADEARNKVFLDRFVREVTGLGHDVESTADAVRRSLTWGFEQFLGELNSAGDHLRRHPQERTSLAHTVTMCHLLLEGVLAVPAEHFIGQYVHRRGILPGFASGIAAIARDEKRHVSFGLQLLKDLIEHYPETREQIIKTLNRALPWTVGVFIPPERDPAYVECFDFTMQEIYAFGLESLESKMDEIGVSPDEVFLLSAQDRTQSYEERAAQMLILVQTGVMGDDRREPRPTREALEILFAGVARAVDVEAARSIGGPIEWDFGDAEPWHLVVTNDHVETKPGRAGNPALTLELSAADWAKIAVGRTDSRRALLTRRLRIHGNWNAKTKLSKLFK